MSGLPTPRERAGQIIRKQVAAWDGVPTMDQLNSVLRIAAMWRSTALAQTFVGRTGGSVVAGGPFPGMTYVKAATEGALIARLLGVYESELHSHFEAFVAEDLECVIDVSCAEGYCAVGLARRMPGVTVYAHDVYRPGALATLMAPFSATHDIQRVDQDFKDYDAPDWVRELNHLDQLLTLWEWHQRPTPWLVMRPKGI